MIRRPPRSTQSRSSAASDVYKRQEYGELSHNVRTFLRYGKTIAEMPVAKNTVQSISPEATKAPMASRSHKVYTIMSDAPAIVRKAYPLIGWPQRGLTFASHLGAIRSIDQANSTRCVKATITTIMRIVATIHVSEYQTPMNRLKPDPMYTREFRELSY